MPHLFVTWCIFPKPGVKKTFQVLAIAQLTLCANAAVWIPFCEHSFPRTGHRTDGLLVRVASVLPIREGSHS